MADPSSLKLATRDSQLETVRRRQSGFPRIIIKTPNWIGDAVMAMPFIGAIRSHWPRAHIAVMTRPRIRPVAERTPGVDAVVDETTRFPLRLAKIFRAGEYDIAFTLASSFSVVVAFRLARIPVRIGFSGGGRAPFLTAAVRPPARSVHQVEHYLALAHAAGVATHGDQAPAGLAAPKPSSALAIGKLCLPRELRSPPMWQILPDDRREAEEFLRSSGVPAGSSLFALAPGASFGPAKRWFRAGWAELGDRLCLNYDGSGRPSRPCRRIRPGAALAGPRIVIVGGSEEREAALSIAALMARQPVLAVGALSLGGTAALLAGCNGFVSNDSGLMHVGAAVGTPTLGLFGSSNPDWTGPVGVRVGSVWGHVPCSPCYRRTCLPGRRYACLKAITVDRVMASLSSPALRSSRRP